MPASDYKGSGGALKLKGGSVTKPKKKKKPKSTTTSQELTKAPSPSAEPTPKTFTSLAKEAPKSGDEEEEVEPNNIYTQSHTTTLSSRPSHATIKTAAEIRADELRKKNLMERLRKEGVKTHKESVEEFNKGLARLSEHHDMPRIGPG